MHDEGEGGRGGGRILPGVRPGMVWLTVWSDPDGWLWGSIGTGSVKLGGHSSNYCNSNKDYSFEIAFHTHSLENESTVLIEWAQYSLNASSWKHFQLMFMQILKIEGSFYAVVAKYFHHFMFLCHVLVGMLRDSPSLTKLHSKVCKPDLNCIRSQPASFKIWNFISGVQEIALG